MKRRYSTVSVPFPTRLMSSSRTPSNMPVEFGREINNIYMTSSGAGEKRNGISSAGMATLSCNIVQLMYYITSSGVLQILAAGDDGKIYLKNGTSWLEKHTGLTITGVVRWAHFANKLIVCNGVDDVLSWDGTAFAVISEWVQDASANLTYISTTSFTIDSDISLYAVGTAVKARLGAGTYVQSSVSAVSENAGTVTVTIADAVLTSVLDEIYYDAKPPAFAYIYAAHDRLWGFGKGPLLADGFSGGAERNFVYYANGFNDETAWHNAQALQYINLSDKMPIDDELTAMGVKDGLTVFFFRNQTQIWAGSDPSVSGNFTWQKTIPLGVIHGDLVVEMPNDIAFFTRFGVRTLGRVLQTEQLDISDMGSEIDPTISAAVQGMLATDADYRKAFAFRYNRQGWYGFKPNDNSLIFQMNAATSGWSIFDGMFATVTATLNTSDGNLYLASGGDLYVYDETIYDDDSATINVKWWTPWLNTSGGLKRWANKYIEVISEQGEFLDINIKRYKSYNSSNYIQSQVSLPKPSDYWDEADWDIGQWDNAYPKPGTARDHYVADVFSYALEESSTKGPLTLFGFKLYGINEK